MRLLMEYLAKFFSLGNPQEEKKLKDRVLCPHIELSVAKLSSNHRTTATHICRVFLVEAIKKTNYHNIIR